MTLKRIGMAWKLGLGAVIACGICLVPIGLPIAAGLVGGGAIVAGQWIVGAAAVAALLFVVLWRMRRRGQQNRTRQEDAPDCCGSRA